MKKNHLSVIAMTAAAFALGVLLCFFAFILCLGGFQNFRSASKFGAVLRVIQTEFVGDYDVEEVTDSALRAAIYSLDDSWSYYMSSEEYASYQDYVKNQYQGIGVTILKDEGTGGFRIESLTVDGPADRAGVLVGEIILACNGTDVTEGSTSELKSLIQSSPDGNPVLTLLAEDGTTREVTVSCEVIETDPVSAELLEDNVGYIRIENFEDRAGAEAVSAVEKLLNQGAEALIFDVRDNPGGSVTELCELLDALLPEGEIFHRSDKNGHVSTESSDAACVEVPMAVLINGSSYSAAEFFAAALREYDAAILVGEATTGKARSQITCVLSDKSAVHISKYSYQTPQGNDLYEEGGLVPDVELALDEEQQAAWSAGTLGTAEDGQVKAAKEALLS